jgi:hypothetical protein
MQNKLDRYSLSLSLIFPLKGENFARYFWRVFYFSKGRNKE